MPLTKRRAASLVDSLRPLLTVENRSTTNAGSDRVAVLAHFSTQARASRSFDELLRQMVERHFRVVVVSAASVREPLRLAPDVSADVTVLRKPNLGYDFGSWALGLAWDPTIATKCLVVLANDSMVGPFTPMDDVIDAIERSGADVVGLTETTQFSYHLQSYFVAYRNAVLTDRTLARFWGSIRHETDKQQIILQNEIGLSRILWREGYALSSVFTARRVLPGGQNPTIIGWRQLLDLGFPFVKRELLLRPEVAPDGEAIPRVLRKQFGIDVGEWL